MLRITEQVDHPFRSKSIRHFGRWQSPVSVDVDQVFGLKPIMSG